MKQIVKRGAPRDYIDWCKAQKGKNNEDYRCLSKDAIDSLRGELVSEQGGLCAYTMRRIDVTSSHIEHIKPETLCRAEKRGSDLDYGNLVACYPKGGMKNPYRYGAQQRNDWWENDGRDFVSPLQKRCEAKFGFNQKGEIFAVNNDVAAQTTIRVLKLDHNSLTEDRAGAIKQFIFGPKGDSPLSIKSATNFIETICEINMARKYREFCIAIRHALVEYVAIQEKIAQGRKFAQIQKNKNK